MKKYTSTTLLAEEKRATIWFLWLFYITFSVYEITYNYLLPMFPWFKQEPANDLNIIIYIILIILLPISIVLLRKNKQEKIKYIYFFAYIPITFLVDLFYYSFFQNSYTSGNVVEIVIILFSPIFVSRIYFFVIIIGIILKYLLTGIILHQTVVLGPILIVIALGIVAYIILHRFLSYVNSLNNSFIQKLEGLVKGVTATLELKDPYTRGHSERVAEYAMSLAKSIGNFKESDLRYFYYSVLLHDIGKVNIPDAILSKTGKLTTEEFDVIKTHPVIGAESVKDVEGISEYIDVILYHHERWDGKGYPEGLKGDQIPLTARITSIADAFDAMTSSRSYRPALPVEEAYKRIIEGKGTQFDPELVEFFKTVFPTWIKIKNKK